MIKLFSLTLVASSLLAGCASTSTSQADRQTIDLTSGQAHNTVEIQNGSDGAPYSLKGQERPEYVDYTRIARQGTNGNF